MINSLLYFHCRVSQSNIDDHDRVKLSRAEELFNSSDISQEGMSSYLYKRMDSLMGNHEHSEGSEVNMPEKWHVKSNVDDHQIILSGSSHSSTLDEMLYKANQVSSQVSRCSPSSVPSQLSNPLIRNREDNEADKGNRQDSVVVNDIQFTFQRKETILSSHRSAPMRTFDRFPNSNVVPLDKGMTNRSVSNHEVNEGNEDMVHEENGYTCQAEQMVPPSEAAIDSSDICFAVGKEFELELSGLKPHYNDGMNMNKSSSLSQSQLREWFPEKLVPFITGSENPVGDGNCGFRALCMALGRNDDTWPSIRAELVKEIESKKDFYSLLFGDEKMKLVERIWHLEGLAPCTKWMDMPSTGFVFAEAFKVVLVHYSKENCWTFVPSLTLPNADSANVEVLGIGLVENNHFVKLDFRYGCPLPPFPHTPSNWRTISSGIVNSWEELLAPRLRACMLMNIPGLLFGQCIAEMVIIDREDPVLHTAAFIDGTHNNYLVNGHRDLNCIDISGEDMKSSEDMHHRFSQPNADHRDGGIDFSIRAHEHREDNEVNVPENAVCEENQVISQMEQNVPPSDADIGSSDNCLALATIVISL